MHCTCKFEKNKRSFLSESYEQAFRSKNHKNHIEVEGEESSFLHILDDFPVGVSSAGGRLSTFLKHESNFDCVHCSALILLIKSVRCSIPRSI